MLKLSLIFVCLTVLINLSYAEDNWIWSKSKNQKVRDYYPMANKRVFYTDEQFTRSERDREPTTKRPIPGQEQNDDIDDYNDANDEPVKQNSPYLPNGGFGNGGDPRFGGPFNGFNNYPQIGGGFPGSAPANGILVGPGGPTGIIGRPQTQFPSGLGPTTFPGGQVGGYPGYPQNFPGAAVNGNAGFPGYNGLNNGLGQYPGQASYPNPQQFAGAQYPQNQYPQGQGQYPQNQYPGSQYPGNHQFTEGYGLANLGPGFSANPPSNFNGYPNYGLGYDEYPAQAEGKSASVKSAKKNVDDKVAKNLKKL